MKYGLFSGAFWALDTIVLGIALSLSPFANALFASTQTLVSAGIIIALVGAAFHDIFCACWLLVYMGLKKQLKKTWEAARTRGGKIIMLAAFLGGPVGMGGYVLAIHTIGPAPTAIISSFYPALGAFFATFFLKEKMKGGQWVALFVTLGAIIFMGVATAETTQANNFVLGMTGAVACALGWGSEAVLLAKGMKENTISNECALQIRETTSAVLYLCIVLPLVGALPFVTEHIISAPTAVIAAAAALGVISYLAYYLGIRKIGAARAMAANISYAAWAVVFSFLLLGKIPTPTEVICCVVILGGTILAASDWNQLFGQRA